MEAKIRAISYYLPQKVVANEDLVKAFPEWSVEKIAKKIGILKRHIADSGELSSDLAVKAAEKLFTEHKISPSEIDFIMLCTQSPDYFLPTTACIIQNRLGIPVKSGAIDFNLGCSGFVYGLALAKGLVFAGVANNILLLTAETYSKFIHPGDKSNLTIFGDAGAAILISSQGYASIEDFDLGTDGKGADNLIVRTGGMRSKTTESQGSIDEYGNFISENHLFMNGGEIFNFTIDMVPPLVANILYKNKIEQEEIDLYIFHQANRYILNHLRKLISLPEERFYYFMEDVGNTVSATIPIALYEAMKEGRIKNGSRVLIAGFGVGYSWGGTILQF